MLSRCEVDSPSNNQQLISLTNVGSRFASWLPSFSVEVMHTTNILGIAQASNSQLNAMVCMEGKDLVYHICLVQYN